MFVRSGSQSKRLLPLVAFYAVLIALFGAWLFYWVERSKDIRAELSRLERQKQVAATLGTFVVELRERSSRKVDSRWALPDPQPLGRKEISDLEAVFRNRMGSGGAAVVSVVPRSMEVEKTYDRVPVDLSAEGEMAALREVLLALCRLPFVDAFRKVEFRALDGDRIRLDVVLVVSVS